MESVNAIQLASITSSETPTVVQLSEAFAEVISTRTFAAVALSESSTRTLKSVSVTCAMEG